MPSLACYSTISIPITRTFTKSYSGGTLIVTSIDRPGRHGDTVNAYAISVRYQASDLLLSSTSSSVSTSGEVRGNSGLQGGALAGTVIGTILVALCLIESLTFKR
jgi:hypothetical protein